MSTNNEKVQLEKGSEMRIDKWLKMVRIFKKREEAADACNLGRVKLNDQIIKASRVVTIGDEITIKKGKEYRTLTIQKIPLRGLKAKDAVEYYHEDIPEISEETQQLLELQQEAEKVNKRRYKGRPTKKERRDWSKFHGF